MAAPNYDTTSAIAYYVDSDMADDSGNGLSWATAKKSLAGARALFASTDEKIIYIKVGSTLSGNNNSMAATGTNDTNVTIVPADGVSLRDYNISKAARDATKIIGNHSSLNYILYTNKSDWYFKSLSLEMGKSATFLNLAGGGGGFVIEDCLLTVNPSVVRNVTNSLLSFDVSADLRRCILRSHGGRPFQAVGTSTITINLENCVLEGDGISTGTLNTHSRTSLRNSYGYVSNSNATVNIINTVDADAYQFGIYCDHGTTNISNSIVYGGAGASAGDGIVNSGGTVNVYNSHLLNLGDPDSANSTLSVKSNCLENGSPKIKSYARGGIVIPCIDDSGNASLVLNSFVPALKNRGLKGSFFTHPGSMRTFNGQVVNYFEDNVLPLFQQIIEDGTVEVGCHSWSHSPQISTVTKLGVLSGPTGAKVSITATDIIFADSEDNVLYQQEWNDETVWGEVFYDVENTFTARSELDGWSFVYDTYDSNTMSQHLKIKQLALVNGAVVPVNLDVNSSYLSVEIEDSKAYLTELFGNLTDPQTGLPYVCNTMATPYGSNDDTSRALCLSTGYLGCRCNGASYDQLTDFDLFAQNYISIESVWGALTPDQDENDAMVKARVEGMCAVAALSGKVLFILGHQNDITYWDPILDGIESAVSEGAVECLSMQQACAKIRQSPWMFNAVTGCSVREYTGVNDWELDTESQLLGAGIGAGITEDIDGNEIPGTFGYDIGPYSYIKDTSEGFGAWAKFFGTMPPLTRDASSSLVIDGVYVWSKLPTDAELTKALGGV